jgi:hypothetical protein
MKKIYALILCFAAISPLSVVEASMAQTPTDQQATASAAPAATWTIDQAVTCSVHDAWVLGGRNEQGFFAIVKALAELSEQKRGVALPDNEEVGRKFGEYIKAQAKADHDQLLYVIVDRAVRMYGAKSTAAAK